MNELLKNFLGDGDWEKYLPFIIIGVVILLIVMTQKDKGLGGLLEKLPIPGLKSGNPE